MEPSAATEHVKDQGFETRDSPLVLKLVVSSRFHLEKDVWGKLPLDLGMMTGVCVSIPKLGGLGHPPPPPPPPPPPLDETLELYLWTTHYVLTLVFHGNMLCNHCHIRTYHFSNYGNRGIPCLQMCLFLLCFFLRCSTKVPSVGLGFPDCKSGMPH